MILGLCVALLMGGAFLLGLCLICALFGFIETAEKLYTASLALILLAGGLGTILIGWTFLTTVF